jgi:hypothetical protein
MNKSHSKLSEKKNRKNTSTAPQKLERYRHASHCHKLFRTIVRNLGVFCDNENCKRRLHNNEVTYVCFRCNFDICSYCFTLPTEPSSMVDLNDSDNEVNEDVLFNPDRYLIKAKTVRINNIMDDDCDEEDDEDEMAEIDFESEDDCDDNIEEKSESQPNSEYMTGFAINPTPTTTSNGNNVPYVPFTSSSQSSSDRKSNLPHNTTPMATITFESKDYDEVTTQAVNSLLSSVPGRLNLVAIPSDIRSQPPNAVPFTSIDNSLVEEEKKIVFPHHQRRDLLPNITTTTTPNRTTVNNNTRSSAVIIPEEKQNNISSSNIRQPPSRRRPRRN